MAYIVPEKWQPTSEIFGDLEFNSNMTHCGVYVCVTLLFYNAGNELDFVKEKCIQTTYPNFNLL